ncbi:MAG: hypothetical protein LBS28_03170 [Streptococcaceae bacterium]|nr:hypothetical protein [Streptococcaceae bacterium]
MDFHEYILPVVLNGANQSAPFEYNLADQSNYRTVVDLQRGSKIAFIPSLIDIDKEAEGKDSLNAGKGNWKFFMSTFSGDDFPKSLAWLCSPLYGNNLAADLNLLALFITSLSTASFIWLSAQLVGSASRI